MMTPRWLVALLLVSSVASASCGAESDESEGESEGSSLRQSSPRRSSSSSSSGSVVTGTGDTFHELCWSTINEYRAREGLPAYARWSDKEACADGQAEADAASGRAHGAFARCGELAQNECPGTPGGPEEAITLCLAAMWAEGPGGGHHDAMASTKYTKVSCGLVETSRGTIWSVQNFR